MVSTPRGVRGPLRAKPPGKSAPDAIVWPSIQSPYIYASRMAAKVDSAAVQDGYQLYHHAFFFSGTGQWCVVQQGMSDQTRTARRYHWLSESVASYINEPHQAICSDVRAPTLNLVAAEHEPIRKASVELAAASPDRVMDVVSGYVSREPTPRGTSRVLPFEETETIEPLMASPTLDMPARHALRLEDFDPRHLRSVLVSTYERAPKDFETLLGLEGVGGRTLRALALVSEVIYGTPASTRDPARFAFAHGGKDGTPFPVDRAGYGRTIDTLHRAMAHARLDRSDKVAALKRLSTLRGRQSHQRAHKDGLATKNTKISKENQACVRKKGRIRRPAPP